jgi:hypothetical protein
LRRRSTSCGRPRLHGWVRRRWIDGQCSAGPPVGTVRRVKATDTYKDTNCKFYNTAEFEMCNYFFSHNCHVTYTDLSCYIYRSPDKKSFGAHRNTHETGKISTSLPSQTSVLSIRNCVVQDSNLISQDLASSEQSTK